MEWCMFMDIALLPDPVRLFSNSFNYLGLYEMQVETFTLLRQFAMPWKGTEEKSREKEG